MGAVIVRRMDQSEDGSEPHLNLSLRLRNKSSAVSLSGSLHQSPPPRTSLLASSSLRVSLHHDDHGADQHPGLLPLPVLGVSPAQRVSDFAKRRHGGDLYARRCASAGTAQQRVD